MRQIFVNPTRPAPRLLGGRSPINSARAFPKAAALMDQAEPEVLAHLQFPAAHRLKIHSTNPWATEQEVKRRANVVGIFPMRPAFAG